MHRLRILSCAALLALVALAAAGCGSDDGDDAGAVAPTTTAAAATTAEVPPTTTTPATDGGDTLGDEPIGGGGTAPSSELAIRLWPEGKGSGEPETYTLTCGPDGGTVPDPALACEAVRSTPFLFAPPPTDQICTEQYGGPAVAEVEGRVQDIAVDFRFSRANGCRIAEWDRAAPLLPLPDGAAPG